MPKIVRRARQDARMGRVQWWANNAMRAKLIAQAIRFVEALNV